MGEQGNSYLNEVLAEQAMVERELSPHQGVIAKAARGHTLLAKPEADGLTSSDFDLGLSEDSGVRYRREPTFPTAVPIADHRITGFWIWKTVVVPPNVYVVHTRRGHEQPIHVGLGISFRYNPYTDAFLIIPAAVQTLLINARCICAERQGVLVQGYVQWVVDDVHTAFRRLDFSDPTDRMRIVKVQLREQAEAAIKDKVATMNIDAILADKQPIIAELTQRLKAVAEGTSEGSSGLGLKIVTVQIKEAVVSSTRVWENLQKPFRAEREKLARMAELEAQQQISGLELANRQTRETAELEVQRRLENINAEQAQERFDREQGEKTRRLQSEHEAARQAITLQTGTEKERKEAELARCAHEWALQQKWIEIELQAQPRQMDLDRLKADHEKQRTEMTIAKEDLVHQAQSGRSERELGILKQRRQIDNDLSEAHVKAQIIARLPEIALNLPKPNELKAVSIGTEASTSLAGFLAGIMTVAEQAGRATANGSAKQSAN